MNTTAKGNAFENQVFIAIKRALESKQLGLDPDSCKIYQKKKYYSEDRQSDIIVDISIEVTRPGAKEVSILWICECKDYKRPLSVEEVEEFDSKLKQIAGKNVKGVIAVSHGSLRPAALNYARSNGIGVVRVLPGNQVVRRQSNNSMWILEHKTFGMSQKKIGVLEIFEALTESEFRGANNFYALADNYIFPDWESLLSNALKET
jgi:hypothetical protein